MAVVGCLVAAIGSINFKTGYRLIFYKTVMSSSLVPPASVRGMTELDRSKFTTSIQVPVILLGEVNLAKVMPRLKKYILKVVKFKPVQNDKSQEETNKKIAFLDPEKVQTFEDIDESDKKILRELNATQIVKRDIELGYENWRYDQIFKAVFPEGIEPPNAYSKVGHLVHLNLRENQLGLKKLIGEVLLDKVSHTRTVVNKLNTIDSTYRQFAMEVIAGDNDTLATVVENGCKYKFDFASVYWNSRLSTEHQLLVSFLKKDDVLYDVFAGVGPFAVPAAVKGCKVLANDLNPESYRWLKENAKANKTRGSFEAFNKDGRDFLRDNVKADLIQRRKTAAKGSEHIAMNLPALAAEFLDVFTELFTPEDAEKVSQRPPTVHLYCFVKLGKDEDPYAAAKTLAEEKLGHVLNAESLVDIHHEKMGKNKTHHKTKNVFKVAGARSLKHKAKAQKVSTDLKKLKNIKPEKKSSSSSSTLGKTSEVDKQLVELRKEVLQAKPAKVLAKESSKKKEKSKDKLSTNTRMATRAQTEAAANLVQGMQI